MVSSGPARAHVVAGGFPPGSDAGHDHDFARLRLLELLAEMETPASVSNDFRDVESWLPVSRLLITYTAGPYPDPGQSRAIRSWLEDGGRWVGLHGTSGGRAVRVEGQRGRRTVKLDHHEVLEQLTDGLPASFEVADEPYFVEIQDPASTRVLLTSKYGPDAVSPSIGTIYEQDTSLMEDGATRALGYVRDMGRGGVTYIALGHCHNPGNNIQPSVHRSVDPNGTTPLTFHGPWETPAFQQLVRNALVWGMRG